MAEVRWIKIYTSMVSNKKIKRIRKLPEGNNIVLIWVFLLAQAGECNRNGALYLTDAMPFRSEDLAIEFDFDVTVINLALITLERFLMIEVFDDIIFIKNWEEYQNIEGMEKIRQQTKLRVARHREEKKQKIIGGQIRQCAYCGESATTIDHIIPRSKGGEDHANNVVACCGECNSGKQDRDLENFLNTSVQLKLKGLDISRIMSNEKLSAFVDYDGNKFVTRKVTLRNATELELELELELDKENKKKRTYSLDSSEYKMALYLHQKIMVHAIDSGVGHLVEKANLQSWADDCRKLLEIDKLDRELIKNVIDWVTAHEFWKTNILSASKLRSKFKELALKMSQEKKKAAEPPKNSFKGSGKPKIPIFKETEQDEPLSKEEVEAIKAKMKDFGKGE